MYLPGTRLSLVRAFGRGPDCYRVVAEPPETGAPADTRADARPEVAELRLNRQIILPGGEAYTIARRGGIFSIDRELRRGAPAAPGEPSLAAFSRERQGLRSRYCLRLEAPAERWLWLRPHRWFGSPANRDVVAVATGAAPAATDPVLARVQMRGSWRRHLQAEWLAPAELPLPVVVFLLSALTELDRRAAAAAAASAAGV